MLPAIATSTSLLAPKCHEGSKGSGSGSLGFQEFQCGAVWTTVLLADLGLQGQVMLLRPKEVQVDLRRTQSIQVPEYDNERTQ